MLISIKQALSITLFNLLFMVNVGAACADAGKFNQYTKSGLKIHAVPFSERTDAVLERSEQELRQAAKEAGSFSANDMRKQQSQVNLAGTLMLRAHSKLIDGKEGWKESMQEAERLSKQAIADCKKPNDLKCADYLNASGFLSTSLVECVGGSYDEAVRLDMDALIVATAVNGPVEKMREHLVQTLMGCRRWSKAEPYQKHVLEYVQKEANSKPLNPDTQEELGCQLRTYARILRGIYRDKEAEDYEHRAEMASQNALKLRHK